MKRLIGQGLSVLLLLGLGLVSYATAGPQEDFNQLQAILKTVTKEKSDPSKCAGWQTSAVPLANSLSSQSCSSGFTLGRVHGSLHAIRLVLKIGNTMLHRHGCKDEAEATMNAARSIMTSIDGACMSGRELNAAKDGIDQSITAIGGMANEVPAGLPDLYPPPGGAPANHCAEESPDLAQVYTVAKAYANANPYAGMNPGAQNGGPVECLPSDPQYIWRATVPGKDSAVPQGPVVIKVNISDWSATQ